MRGVRTGEEKTFLLTIATDLFIYLLTIDYVATICKALWWCWDTVETKKRGFAMVGFSRQLSQSIAFVCINLFTLEKLMTYFFIVHFSHVNLISHGSDDGEHLKQFGRCVSGCPSRPNMMLYNNLMHHHTLFFS